MIIADFLYNSKSGELICDITGHAGGEKGKDLVCAGASMLAMTLAQNIEDLAASGVPLPESPTAVTQDGLCHIRVKATEEQYNAIRLIFNTIATGFFLLAYNFPDRVACRTKDEK